MNTETIQDDQPAVDLDLDKEFLTAIRDVNSPSALQALRFHSIASDLLAEASSEGRIKEIPDLTDWVKHWRDAVVSRAETDRAVDRLTAIHAEIKAERAIP